MKHLMIITILASLFSGMAFSAESKTECPWMKEQNRRNNPKVNLSTQQVKVKIQSKSVIGQ